MDTQAEMIRHTRLEAFEEAARIAEHHGASQLARIIRAAPTIKTKFWAKPIPDRRFDWEAVEEDYDEGSPMGFGSTEQDAIAALLEQIEAAS